MKAKNGTRREALAKARFYRTPMTSTTVGFENSCIPIGD
jgi:hypothetical protein